MGASHPSSLGTSVVVSHLDQGEHMTILMSDRDMAHPALATLAWDDDHTDIHAIAVISTVGGGQASFTCACGYETAVAARTDAHVELIEHALTTCANCGGPKPSTVAFGPKAGAMDTFPRCSACAL